MTALENEIKRYQDLKINLYSDMADGVISVRSTENSMRAMTVGLRTGSGSWES